jgi:diaminopimelate decarboxylase
MALAPSTSLPDPADQPDIAALLAARPHLAMHAMDGLVLEDVPLHRIADAVGTPTWVYGAGTMRRRYRALAGALAAAGLDADLHYAMKANDHLAVLRLFAAEGAGADVVSAGELARARAAGIAPDRIVFSGVGKSDHDLRTALAAGIGQINVESAEELDMLSALASGMGRIARIALRVNPDVDAATHAKISTGRAGDKFGIPWADAAALYHRAAALPGIVPVGLATHIGSQILSLAPFRAAYARIAELVAALRQAGAQVSVVDCGGGLGIPYRDEPAPSPAGLAGALRATFHNLDVRLKLEPGRWLVGPAGLLLASVLLTKQTGAQRFVVLDAAMNDLVRPAMYDAWHGVVPLSAAAAVAPASPADIVGPVCETGDTFARNRLLPLLQRNARVALLDAGAYGSVMSSTYNARPLAAEVMVDGGRWAVIRPRQPVEALWAHETIPDFLGADFLGPDRLGPDRLAPDGLAPAHFAQDPLAADHFARDPLAPDPLAPDPLAPDRLAPDRLA